MHYLLTFFALVTVIVVYLVAKETIIHMRKKRDLYYRVVLNTNFNLKYKEI